MKKVLQKVLSWIGRNVASLLLLLVLLWSAYNTIRIHNLDKRVTDLTESVVVLTKDLRSDIDHQYEVIDAHFATIEMHFAALDEYASNNYYILTGDKSKIVVRNNRDSESNSTIRK